MTYLIKGSSIEDRKKEKQELEKLKREIRYLELLYKLFKKLGRPPTLKEVADDNDIHSD